MKVLLTFRTINLYSTLTRTSTHHTHHRPHHTHTHTHTQRGFTPAHSAAYNNHLSSLQVLLDFNPPSTTNSAKATPNTLSKDKESLLHITCFRGHLKLAQFLVSREANLGATDCHGNSVLHSAAGSDSGVLVKWLIDQLSEDVESAVNARNKVCVCSGRCLWVWVCIVTFDSLSLRVSNFKTKICIM